MVDEAPTVEELLARVENRNRGFKIASVIFGVVLAAGLAILLIIGLHTLQGVNNQLTAQKTLLAGQTQTLNRIGASSKQRTEQINDLQKHIDCVVALFQQPNRANLTITDLEGCKISSSGTVGTNISASNSPVALTPPQTSNSGATSKQNTTSGGVAKATTPTATPAPTKTATPAPASNSSTLDRVPVLGRVFKALGL